MTASEIKDQLLDVMLKVRSCEEKIVEVYAKEQQMQLIGCEILEIADEMPTCTVPDPDGGVSARIDNAGIQRNRLRVDTRKWLMSKLAPKTYGDKVQTEVTGANGGPIQASVVVEFVKTGQSVTNESTGK